MAYKGRKLYSRFTQAPRHQQALGVIITLLVLILVIYLIVRLIQSYNSFHNDNLKIIDGTITMNQTITIPDSQLPKSVDQRFGIEFSYACWLYIDKLGNSSSSNNTPLHVFHKGTNFVVRQCCVVFNFSHF